MFFGPQTALHVAKLEMYKRQFAQQSEQNIDIIDDQIEQDKKNGINAISTLVVSTLRIISDRINI